MRKAIDRRRFLQVTAGGVAQSSLAPTSGPGQAASPSWGGAVVQADEGERLVAVRRRAPMRIKVDSRSATGATMSMVVSEVSPGANIPVHLHRNEDELIFIHT